MKYTQPLKTCWLILLIAFVVVMQGCAAKSPSTAAQGTLVQISKIEPKQVDGKTEIAIEGNEPILQFTSFELSDPLRLVVDISDADVGKIKDKITVNNGGIIDITPSQKDNIARLEIALTQSIDTKVYQTGGKLMIEIEKPPVDVAKAASPEATTPAPTVPVAPPAPAVETPKPAAEMPKEEAPVAAKEEPKPEAAPAPQPEQPTATVVSKIKATAGKDGVKVVITADGTMNPKVFPSKDGKKVIIDIAGVRSKVKPSVVPVRKGGLDKVRVGQHTTPEKKVRVVLDLTRALEYTVMPEGNTLVVAMGVAAATKTTEKQQQEHAAQEPAPAPASEKEIAAAPAPEAIVPPPPVPVEKKERVETAKAEPKQERPSLETTMLTGGSRFSGRKISLDLQDADLVNVMRLFAEVANLNIILAPDVKGKVTVRMVNIPWDQAMEIILKMNGLGYALEDNILRIASVGALTKEADEDLRAKEAKKKAEDLITRIVPINYATAGTVEATIKKSLSTRGETVTDTRTNTLIIKDIAKNVDEVVSLIKILDKPIPQIMIEARIVEASLTFNRQLGVQWGGKGSMDAAHGNPTGLAFPNTIGVTGGPTMGSSLTGGNYLVNMPAAAGAGTGGGAIGISFGSLSKAVNLDLVLSALESTGEGKVISSPRVSALDNKEAKIEQGLSIPFSTTSSSGTQIQFIDAKLSLVVTPHATPDNKVFLHIKAARNAPDTSLLGASGQPSIRKNEAETEVLLGDGETAVIGGILVIDRGSTITKVPFFGDLPLIGWLFRSHITNENKTELIIFITPKVVRQDVI